MKTIKIYIEGGVCTDVVIPEEFHNKLNYEVIDYDNIEAEEDEKNKFKMKASSCKRQASSCKLDGWPDSGYNRRIKEK